MKKQLFLYLFIAVNLAITASAMEKQDEEKKNRYGNRRVNQSAVEQRARRKFFSSSADFSLSLHNSFTNSQEKTISVSAK